MSDFPTEKYNEYLKQCGCVSDEKLDDEKIENILKLAYSEFKENKLTVGDFCLLGEYLFYQIKEQTSKFASALLDCSELNYYIQIRDNDSNEFNLVMKRIEEYFD